jgi:hypothetical protein
MEITSSFIQNQENSSPNKKNQEEDLTKINVFGVMKKANNWKPSGKKVSAVIEMNDDDENEKQKDQKDEENVIFDKAVKRPRKKKALSENQEDKPKAKRAKRPKDDGNRDDATASFQAPSSSTSAATFVDILKKTTTMSAEEMELSRLRLELGEVLSRQADFRAKEKRLRGAIRKLQKKMINSFENGTGGCSTCRPLSLNNRTLLSLRVAANSG